jgi:acid stress-induced BolA-like protein IbaG/YrbA
MQASEVEKLIRDKIEDIDVTVETDGYQYQVTAIGEVFSGLTPVKKQQLIYSCLNEYIIDGTIHAVTIKTFTPQEWDEKA